ncbi:MAG: hypothetical protein Q8L98_08310 [Chlamydiales bacterium]|nr:hypothetical protein [Chlamydiales bacterium]
MMNFVRHWAFVLFLFSCFGSFAGEILQGTLKNGMRYYLWPDFSVDQLEIALVVKTPEKYPFFPSANPFTDDFLTSSFFELSSTVTLEHRLFHGALRDSLRNGLFDFSVIGLRSSKNEAVSKKSLRKVCAPDGKLDDLKAAAHFSKCLKSEVFSNEVIRELREEYQEDMEDEDSKIRETYLEMQAFLLSGYEPGDLDSIFSKEDSLIHEIYHAFFEPCRMALIVTGSFDAYGLERELEHLFGEILGDGVLMDFLKFKVERPVAITLKGEGVADDYFGQKNDELSEEDEELCPQEVNLYHYQFDPSFKNHVLNHLFYCTHFDLESVFCSAALSELERNACFPFQQEIPSFEVDELLFSRAKIELEKIYKNDVLSKVERCRRHYCSEIADELEPSNQNFLRELESINLDDLNLFIREQIKPIAISREFNFL